ncbi:unnamed protein product [Kuraishia capsulata CBS 1993]|uniref:DUF1593 domain-containing protein n=1 Tax=Kuraishia capsulata CBS 1993 TaxID=1382522 RepID=W6MRZ2_9ASCO|nr:uncharacterized protein KUCA_T00005518001 [Kuraishia capsulata CBS 1993]CDK29526.1 unnamed protein product [Kuraishia capsulata CBS 1993]
MIKYSIIACAALLFTLIQAQLVVKDVKPRAFILTDISNEPDDAESLVRALLYSNEIDYKGIVATTSYWLNDTIHVEDIYPILDAYEKDHSNLLKHSPHFPTADYLRSIVSSGHPVYGTLAFDFPKISEGAANLIKAVDATPDTEKIWILMWGGAGVLAESLNEISKTKSKKYVERFVEKLRVYSISDQDDAGSWIRLTYPRLFYIASIHGWNQYALSSWVGISGDLYNSYDSGGPDINFVSKEWISKNIQKAGGNLGTVYPDYMFIMEGDTPSLLHIIPNGLNDPENPKHGGWGGRYDVVDISGRLNHYAGVTDNVVGLNGITHLSDKATIWRWREDVQNDFAARMQWTVKSFESANHAPVVIVNGSESVKPLELQVETGSEVYLDATASYDLDSGRDGKLSFKWFQYRDASATMSNAQKEVAAIDINSSEGKAHFTVPDLKAACYNVLGKYLGDDHCYSYHIILEVTDAGSPPMKSYRRVILHTKPKKQEEESKHDEL